MAGERPQETGQRCGLDRLSLKEREVPRPGKATHVEKTSTGVDARPGELKRPLPQTRGVEHVVPDPQEFARVGNMERLFQVALKSHQRECQNSANLSAKMMQPNESFREILDSNEH
jgi:hypothetical protein